ncbi:glycosyltransferase family 4 protein [Catenovulum sp. SM1970]|uniref:glycosyltransferase family 4 protein n=1 Tax=Marinifaba aquimaris TaxID=2741323 RepID=UPI0015745435|nr:glycosyltransferase family 4 protein [Marinifaba aquimaris]NTS76902.1 glycosyltransferase family 4 protein [Marinifaba aquimaris]
MKVLHYTPKFSVMSETFIYDQITGLARQDELEVKVVTSQLLNLTERPFSNLDLIPLRFDFHPRVTRKLAFGLEWLPLFLDYKKWKKLLSSYQPEVIHCHTGHGIKTVIHILDKLGLDIPILASLHGSDVTMEPLITKRYRPTLATANQSHQIYWTVPSAFLKQQAVSKLGLQPENIRVVYNAFNPIFFDKSKGNTLNHFKILCIGRFIKCKGQAYLIEAFANAKKVIPELSLTLVGQGPELETCKRLATKLFVKDCVSFIPYLEHAVIPEVIREHSLYIQPSLRDRETQQEESFGVAALEALVCGCPVAVSNSGGLPEVVADIKTPNAYIFEQANAPAIQNVIQQHFEKNEILDDVVPAFAADKFSQRRNLAMIEDSYNKLINKLLPSTARFLIYDPK